MKILAGLLAAVAMGFIGMAVGAKLEQITCSNSHVLTVHVRDFGGPHVPPPV